MFIKDFNIKSNTLLFIRYPEGEVLEPIKPKEGQYFGRPIYYDNHIVILLVDFHNQRIKLEQYNDTLSTTSRLASIPRSDVKDCYNLMMHTSPLMLTRQGNENKFEIIYPNKFEINIGDNESFCFRKDDKLYFSAWFEDEDYREEVIVRDINTGEIVERKSSAIKVMPDGQIWIFS